MKLDIKLASTIIMPVILIIFQFTLNYMFSNLDSYRFWEQNLNKISILSPLPKIHKSIKTNAYTINNPRVYSAYVK